MMMNTLPSEHFYRRELPSTCIAISSTEGKALFKESMRDGNMECYFILASQFRTQEEPAFCGLSTLVMVLNTLSVDPGKVWKGPWRWYHENMLDCCVPLKLIETSGITMKQFQCLAECNGLVVDDYPADGSTSVNHFRTLVQDIVVQSSQVLVASYSRAVLSQTGDGHYSPIGGYHSQTDSVLLMDVARFKYPPHWVSLSLLYEAMTLTDPDTGTPRGYIVLEKDGSCEQPVLFRMWNKFSKNHGNEVSTMIVKWRECLKNNHDDGPDESSDVIIKTATHNFLLMLKDFNDNDVMLTSRFDQTNCLCMSEEHFSAITDIIYTLGQTKLFKIVQESLEIAKTMDILRINSIFQSTSGRPSCSQSNNSGFRVGVECLEDAHYISILLLAWPYECACMKYCQNLNILKELIITEKQNLPQPLLNEIRYITRMIRVMFKHGVKLHTYADTVSTA